jgi:hypothetical protein
MVPAFTKKSIDQGGTQLCPGSLATLTPQIVTVASPPAPLTGFGVDPIPTSQQDAGHALHTGPYPPDLSRPHAYETLTTDSLSLHLLVLLAGPGPSGSTDPSRRCRGHLPPSPAFPGSGCPQLLPDRCDGPAAKVSHLRSITWRLVAHDRLVGDHDPALGHHLLRLVEAEREAVVEPHAVTDDLCRVSETLGTAAPRYLSSPRITRRLSQPPPQVDNNATVSTIHDRVRAGTLVVLRIW